MTSLRQQTNTLETTGPYGATPLRSEAIPAQANWVFALTQKEKKRFKYRKDFLQEHWRTTYIKDGSWLALTRRHWWDEFLDWLVKGFPGELLLILKIQEGIS